MPTSRRATSGSASCTSCRSWQPPCSSSSTTVVDAFVVVRLSWWVPRPWAPWTPRTQPVLGLLVDFFVGLLRRAPRWWSASLWGAHEDRAVEHGGPRRARLLPSIGCGLAITVVGLSLGRGPCCACMNTPAENMGLRATPFITRAAAAASCSADGRTTWGRAILRAVGDSRRPFYFLAVCTGGEHRARAAVRRRVRLGRGGRGRRPRCWPRPRSSAVLAVRALCRATTGPAGAWPAGARAL